MPQFLKSAAIELLLGSVEMYKLALFGLGLPKTTKEKGGERRYAPIVALLGTSTELLVKTFIAHGLGIEKIYINDDVKSGKYKNFVDLIKLLERNIKQNSNWIKDLLYVSPNEELREDTMIKYLSKIRMLQQLRSAGLHGGKGCARDMAVVLANDIYSLFDFLSKNKRFKAYLKNIPIPDPVVKSREAIIEDLKRHIKVDTVEGMRDYISNLFLVLPYIPDNAPDWIEEFEKVAIAAPTEDDMVYLVKTLESAHSISLLKSRGGGDIVPVRVERNNPDAIPVSPESFKKRLKNSQDIFYNAVNAANTRFEKGQMDLPCDAHLIELFDTSIDVVQMDDEMLKADEVWSFLAAAMSFPGTPLPCFQFIKYCDELPKVRWFIEKAKHYAKGHFRNRSDILLMFLDAKIKKQEIDWGSIKNTRTTNIFNEIKDFAPRYGVYNSDMFSLDFIKNTSVDPDVNNVMVNVLHGNVNAGDAIKEIVNIDKWSDDEKKVVAQLLENCNDFSNRHAFKAILEKEELKTYHTITRKKMLFIDFYYNFVGEDKIKNFIISSNGV